MHKWSKLATSGLPFLSLCLSYILVLVQILHAKGGLDVRPSTIKQLQAGTRIYMKTGFIIFVSQCETPHARRVAPLPYLH